MSAQRFFVPAAAGATAIGGYLYYNSKQPAKSREQQRRERSQDKRDAGLSGAGVGQNAMTGLHEKGGPGSGVPTANTDPDRAVKTDAPKEKLPSGGVGGGVGAGGANSRTTVDISAKKPTTEQTSSSSWSQGLQGVFGQGGASAGDSNETHKKYHDTKVHSNHADTPTKRFPGETVK